MAFICASVLLLLSAGIIFSTEFSFRGSLEGLYLLRGRRKPLALRNDLYLDEQERLIVSISFEPVRKFFKTLTLKPTPNPPFLDYEWETSSGDGFIVNRLPGDALLIINWSRFLDDSGRSPSGLFLGGGLPYPLNKQAETTLNDTGMAYFDGSRWYHGWCNINELITLVGDQNVKFHTSDWEFLGSQVLDSGPDHLLLTSRHRVRIEGTPVSIQKWAFIRAGDLYFTLATRFVNEGAIPAAYYYLYGDEPWVGNYGTSRGNVGWTKSGLVFYEGLVDTETTNFIGFFDGGNSAIGEKGPFTHTANFLQWFGHDKPSLAYFTNMSGHLQEAEKERPLSARYSRALFLQWGPERLPPGGGRTYLVSLGMIPGKPGVLLPIKPPVSLDPRLLKYLINRPAGKQQVRRRAR